MYGSLVPSFSVTTLSRCLVLIVGLAGCSFEDASNRVSTEVRDCLDEDGCPAEGEGTPLSAWAPPIFGAAAQFGDDEDFPSLYVYFIAREWTPFCPEVPPTISATVDGRVLERNDPEVVFGCPEVVWELGPNDWPTDHTAESTVEVTDGETSFTISAPFSLTEEPTWALDDPTLERGATIELPPVSRVSDAVGVIHAGFPLGQGEIHLADSSLVEGTVRIDIPTDIPDGPNRLVIGYSAGTDIECPDTEYCEASLYGQQFFDVEVLP